MSETHTSYADTLTCEGYKCSLNCRSTCPSKKRGGLAVFIKRNILPGISLIDKTLSELMWFKLNANFLGFVRDLYVCFIYIAPVNSSYVKSTGLDKQVFAKLEEDIVRYNLKDDIMLMGDLSAHINSDDYDFIYNDDDNILESFLPNNYTSDNHQLFRNTQTQQITNTYGKTF